MMLCFARLCFAALQRLVRARDATRQINSPYAIDATPSLRPVHQQTSLHSVPLSVLHEPRAAKHLDLRR